MLSRLLFSALLVALLSSAVPIKAQQTAPASSPEDEKSAATRKRALALLETLAGQLPTLQSPENRARIGSNIAGSIWPHDEQKARALFATVQEDLKFGLQLVDSNDERERHTFQVFSQLRADTIERIAKHDPEYALTFLKATKVQHEKPQSDEIRERDLEMRDPAQDTDLEIKLAQRLIPKRPELALALAKETLKDGLTTKTISIFNELYLRDKALGSSFHEEIVKELKEQKNPFADWTTLGFVRALMVSHPMATTNEPTFRDLVSWVITSALNNDCAKKDEDNYACRQLGPIMGHLMRVDPTRASLLKHWQMPDDEEDSGSYEVVEMPSGEGVDEILRLAQRHPQVAGAIISRAITKAAINGDFEQAEKLATGYDGSPDVTGFLKVQLEALRKWAAMNEETAAEVQQMLSKLKLPAEQVELLITVANQIAGSNRAAALKLLNQANAIVEGMKPGREQVEAQLRLAKMYCQEKSNRGFEIVENLIPRLNDLVDAGVKLDGFDNRYLREGEWTMTAEGGVGSLLTQLASDAPYYAWLDFDRSVELSNRFTRQEIRMMSQLKLAQGILAGPPQRIVYRMPARL